MCRIYNLIIFTNYLIIFKSEFNFSGQIRHFEYPKISIVDPIWWVIDLIGRFKYPINRIGYLTGQVIDKINPVEYLISRDVYITDQVVYTTDQVNAIFLSFIDIFCLFDVFITFFFSNFKDIGRPFFNYDVHVRQILTWM